MNDSRENGESNLVSRVSLYAPGMGIPQVTSNEYPSPMKFNLWFYSFFVTCGLYPVMRFWMYMMNHMHIVLKTEIWVLICSWLLKLSNELCCEFHCSPMILALGLKCWHLFNQHLRVSRLCYRKKVAVLSRDYNK